MLWDQTAGVLSLRHDQCLQKAASQDPQVEGSRTVSKQMGQSNLAKISFSSGENWSRHGFGLMGRGMGFSSGSTTWMECGGPLVPSLGKFMEFLSVLLFRRNMTRRRMSLGFVGGVGATGELEGAFTSRFGCPEVLFDAADVATAALGPLPF